MKRFLNYCFLVLFFKLAFSASAYSKIGKGELNISDQTLDYFIQFLRNEFSNSFIISKDGKNGYYGLCHSGKCMGGEGSAAKLLSKCKKETGDKCFIFAQTKKKKKIIRWNDVNYVFPEGEFDYVGWYKDSESEGIKKKYY